MKALSAGRARYTAVVLNLLAESVSYSVVNLAEKLDFHGPVYSSVKWAQ